MPTYDLIRDLPLTVEDVSSDNLEQQASTDFLRRTTVVRLAGGGVEGVGEDVVYSAELHPPFQALLPTLPLTGEWTLESFSQRVGELDLFGDAPEQGVYRAYRRWAVESAALDLALRQAGRSLAAVVGREPQPVRFVCSLNMGHPPSMEGLRRRLAANPEIRFKLDATSDWDDAIFDELVALGCVDSVDFKGAYRGTAVDQPPDPVLYRRVAETFPDAWLEDPNLTPETDEVLRPYRDRVTWDAVIHSVADVEDAALPAEDGERQAVPVRRAVGAVRRLRLPRGAGDRRLRRRPVRAGRRPRPDPGAGVAVPRRRAQRHRARRLQPARPAGRAASQPARAAAGRPRLRLAALARQLPSQPTSRAGRGRLRADPRPDWARR